MHHLKEANTKNYFFALHVLILVNAFPHLIRKICLTQFYPDDFFISRACESIATYIMDKRSKVEFPIDKRNYRVCGKDFEKKKERHITCTKVYEINDALLITTESVEKGFSVMNIRSYGTKWTTVG